LYCLRIKNIIESERDKIIQKIFEQDVAVNVHYRPLPLLTAFSSKGYRMGNYPVAYQNYAREITLPVWYGMTDEMIDQIIKTVVSAVQTVD
jgi:dTDP-4-amino-4,6-dideoxygalactose transaminase